MRTLQEIWDEGNYSRDPEYTLQKSFMFWHQKGRQLGIPPQTVELAIQEIFMEMHKGRRFSLDKCSCGCDSKKSGTDLEHSVLRRMLDIHAVEQETLAKIYEKRVDAMMGKALREGKDKHPLFRWQNSPVLKALKWRLW